MFTIADIAIWPWVYALYENYDNAAEVRVHLSGDLLFESIYTVFSIVFITRLNLKDSETWSTLKRGTSAAWTVPRARRAWMCAASSFPASECGAILIVISL